MPFFDEIPGRIFLVAAVLPLAAAVLLFLAGTVQRLRQVEPDEKSVLAGWFAVLTMAAAAACSILGTLWILNDYSHYGDMPATLAGRWTEKTSFLEIGKMKVDARPMLAIPLGFAIDRLTALMMCMVTVIGTLIFLFSLGYMKEELKEVHDHAAHVHRRGRFARFFFYMLLFAFSMLFLLISDNLLQVFVSWELVGVCSFLLIGFYYERKNASTAANKAFIMNRVGDAGFLIGLAILFTNFGTFNFHDLENIFATKVGGGLEHSLWIVLGLGLFAGCVGKSAQFPLQTWLPDAMEGPTPVSALIHAATMVAAGVYLCARCLPFFAPEVLNVIAWIGAITLFISAATATVQTDIKRVLAFSTCSQLGYMMLALGLAGWTAGLFHLLTHAFFKALLFLCAGSVICALHHEQDLMKMGGLRKKMPITAYTMLIGVAAIIGVPLFSGWYSKDLILAYALGYGAYNTLPNQLLSAIPFITVSLTGYYMMRLWLLAFAGEPRDRNVYDHAYESSSVMTLPLLILAAFSIGVAWGWPIWDAHASWLEHTITQAEPWPIASRIGNRIEDSREYAHRNHARAELAGFGFALVGVVLAVISFRKSRLTQPNHSGLNNLAKERFYFDAIYNAIFTQPTVKLSRSFGAFDKQQSAGPDHSLDGAFTGAGTLVVRTGESLSPMQSGSLRGYIMLLGLTVAGSLAILWAILR